MEDFKFTNICNHRVINEELKIKGSYPGYYAILKSPVKGNNFKVFIRNQNNLFDINQKTIKYLLEEDKRTIYFNIGGTIEVDVRDNVYPKNTYYATYYTDAEHCPRCINMLGYANDIDVNAIGKIKMNSGFDLLVQKFKKALITSLGSNIFNYEYGSKIPDLIGKPNTALTILLIQSAIRDTADLIKSQQLNNFDAIPDEEKLLKVDDFEIMPGTTEKQIKYKFKIYNYASQSTELRFEI